MQLFQRRVSTLKKYTSFLEVDEKVLQERLRKVNEVYNIQKGP